MTAPAAHLIGVVLALMTFNSTLSMFSVFGMVVPVMGLVTKERHLAGWTSPSARRKTGCRGTTPC